MAEGTDRARVPPPMAGGPRRPAAIRRDAGLWGYERALWRRGLGPVAGVDEAGRGACAGPLVVAAVVLPDGRRPRLGGLADSKLLSPAVREEMYVEVVRAALAWRAVVIGPADIDRTGLHRCNIEGMRRAVAGLDVRPGYVLTDGFPVPGMAVPSLAVIKGDQVAASVCAASIIAKVTRDRIMVALHDQHPEYDFWRHKGYVTPAHAAALDRHGPSTEHRLSYANVAEALRGRDSRLEDTETMASLDSGVRV